MEKQIELQNKKVPCTLKISARSKRLSIAVNSSGALVVTAPRSMVDSAIEKFLIEKSQWVVGKIEYFKKFSAIVSVRKSTREHYLLHKESARTLAMERLAYFNKAYGLAYNRISIKNQSTRWGSCSSRGNLNFNYKIVLLPPRLVDYIIVHELCHLSKLNHSQKFWNLVEKTIPDFLKLKKELKRSGISFY